jgi:hypothetical protein
MAGPPISHRETENVALVVESSWMTQRLAEQTTNSQNVLTGDVTCEALHLALKALHIDLAWHAGVLSAEVAMEDLHRAIGRAIRSSSVDVGRDGLKDNL